MKKLLLLATRADENYLPRFKTLITGHQVYIKMETPTTLSEVTIACQKAKIDAVLVTNESVLQRLVAYVSPNVKKEITLDNYAGSLLHHSGVDYLILNPLEHLVTVDYAKFLFTRYLTKVLAKERWYQQTEFTWEIANENSIELIYEAFAQAALIAVDIETTQDALAITCAGYCAVFFENGKIETHTVVIPCTSMFFLTWIRKFNQLPAGKIFQNGQYDNAYFLRFNAPVYNWLHDTQNMFHSWYSELPKRLDFIAAFTLRDVYFWKNESDTNDLEQYYRYNARDCWATANSYLSMLTEVPEYVLANYQTEFPLNYPCLQAAMEGLAIDNDARTVIRATQDEILTSELRSLQTMLAVPEFNPSSPKQVTTLWKLLGCSDIKSSNVKDMDKVAARHPLNAHIVHKIIAYREARKLLSTYIDVEQLNGRLMYALNPAGTDTGRLASKASQFWCGTQIQNIPPYAKQMVVADPGYHLAEIDFSQSEARCVAYLSQDANLIATVESDKDYHKLNAEMFFGTPYDQVDDNLRQLSKRVNHGSNYNMGANVLIETMTPARVWEAKRILKLPAKYNLREVAQYLLDRYAAAYPMVKGDWYNEIIYEVQTTGQLRSVLGWTRQCFSDPSKNKRALNKYVAHVPQNLSVAIINKAFMQLFKWQLESYAAGSNDFRLKAQIHDSILFQYRIGQTALVAKAKALMTIPVQVNGRTLLIPADVKCGDRRWSALKKWKE